MKSAFSPQRVFSHLEPLEARIAPARVISVGDPTTIADNYTEYDVFVNTEDGSDSISQAVGPGVEGQDDTFYLKLSSGDLLNLFSTTSGPQPYLKVNSGKVVAFFIDIDQDQEMDPGELVSLSLGKNASVTLYSGLAGSVVTNYDEKNDTIVMDGLVSSKQGIKNLDIKRGDVVGNILSGGDISRVTMNGRVTNILAGSAAHGATFEIFPGLENSGQGTISFIPEAGQKGASISNIFIDAVGTASNEGRIEAGAGGAGAAGGSLKNIRLVEDFDGFTLKAGDGGNATGKTKGGLGGSISSITIAGVRDSVANELIQIRAGLGGDSESGAGGTGGSVSKVLIGYDVFGTKAFPSGDMLKDNVLIEAGTGGDGQVGGKGGAVSNLDVRVTTPDVPEMADLDEVVIRAGDGGAGEKKAGIGGSLSQLKISNSDGNDLDLASMLVQAGDGGNAGEGGKGAGGGSVSKTTLFATSMRVLAGDGSVGKTGGAGGDLMNITVEQLELVTAHVGIFNAGKGGDGTAGNGGVGGNISRLMVKNGDFRTLEINSETAGDGGSSVGGKGGAGGSVSKVSIIEDDYATNVAFAGTLQLRSGNGGDGSKGGGNGGLMSSIDFTAEDFAALVQTGAGGDVVGQNASGKGGAGGALRGARIISEGVLSTIENTINYVNATVLTGAGGAGAGAKGSGGAGGDIKNLFVNVEGAASVRAGNGGNGTEDNGKGGAAGRGGSVIQAGVFATVDSGEIFAGNGAELGDKPADGGSIIGKSNSRLTGLYASTNVTLQAGNGTNGGAGGSIRNIGYGSTETDLLPTPSGNILVQAGNGSAEGRFAGSGGSIFNVTGSVSSSANTFTHIYAGVGGGNDNKSAAGGSIVDLRIQRGGSPVADGNLAELRILAGDAGDGGENVRVGAKGGDVRNVRIFEISNLEDATDTVVRSIAAGNGGDAAGKGGTGGSLDNIRVLDHDIGVRSGESFGYETMGGLFAGEGGASGASGKGLSGNVTNVTAKAIASIVAGRGDLPAMVEKIESIYLFSTRETGTAAVDLLELEPQPGRPSDLDITEGGETGGLPGWYAFRQDAYENDNLVGAVADPYRVDGNKFAFVLNEGDTPATEYDFFTHKPIDGLIAARVFNQAKVNFTPEARVVDGVFYDYDNRNA